MTTTGKVLTFLGIGATIALIYNANKKPDTDTKSGFLGFNSKTRLQVAATQWCDLDKKRGKIAAMLASGTVRGAAETTELQRQISTIVAQMNSILTSLQTQGYTIFGCHAVPMGGKKGINGPDWQGMCFCNGVWAHECCNRSK